MKNPTLALSGILIAFLPILFTQMPPNGYELIGTLLLYTLASVALLGIPALAMMFVRNPILDGVLGSLVATMIGSHFVGNTAGFVCGSIASFGVFLLYKRNKKNLSMS